MGQWAWAQHTHCQGQGTKVRRAACLACAVGQQRSAVHCVLCPHALAQTCTSARLPPAAAHSFATLRRHLLIRWPNLRPRLATRALKQSHKPRAHTKLFTRCQGQPGLQGRASSASTGARSSGSMTCGPSGGCLTAISAGCSSTRAAHEQPLGPARGGLRRIQLKSNPSTMHSHAAVLTQTDEFAVLVSHEHNLGWQRGSAVYWQLIRGPTARERCSTAVRQRWRHAS